MKRIILLSILNLLFFNTNAQERVNQILDALEISPTTISFHPKGDILISTRYNREDKSQFLLVITKSERKIKIDTLSTSRPNRSAFSKDGDYLIHNFRDEVSGNFYTVKRKYDGPEDIGVPFYISEELFANNMYYYFMDDNQDFYYYTYVRNNRPEGGLLYSKFENGRYQKPQMIHPDRENAVAYSPLLLDENTMIFAQHGIKDNTFQGIHFSFKDENGEWSEPILLEDIPMSNVITYYNEDTVAFLVAETNRIKFLNKNEVLKIINDKTK